MTNIKQNVQQRTEEKLNSLINSFDFTKIADLAKEYRQLLNHQQKLRKKVIELGLDIREVTAIVQEKAESRIEFHRKIINKLKNNNLKLNKLKDIDFD